MAERSGKGHQETTEQRAPPDVRAPAGRLVLRVMGDGGAATFVLPTAGTVVLGRGEEADLRLGESSVSRRHAALHVPTEGAAPLQIEDLESSNGTRVRGQGLRPGERVDVRPGDVFELGSALCMVQGPARGDVTVQTRDAAPSPGAQPDASGTTPDIVVADPAMQRLHALLARVARGGIHVLLLGETGVGKEVFAARIHALSRRRDRPFVKLNCAVFTDTLIESELFGHERGAFTGAVATKRGLLEAADGGTVFLDEVGELSLGLQAKLLRALEEGAVRRVGALREQKVDVRFVAATNRDLEAEVARGRFREDLYFRLNGFSLVIPALRERVDEIAPLARRFVAQASTAAGRSTAPALSPEALALLTRHRWPGNIRELRNVMERAVLLADGDVITPEHLPVEKMLASPAAPFSPDADRGGPVETIEAVREAAEREHILAVLERCGGNQTRAAQMLGLSRRALIKRLENYGLPRPRKGRDE